MLKSVFVKLSQASVLLPVIAGLVHYKKLTRPFRVLLYFFLSAIVFEAQASILKIIYKNNMPGLHLFTLTEFLVFSTVYYHHFQKGSIMRLFIGINAIVFIGACFTDIVFINGIWGWNTLGRSYSSLSMICYTLIYFYFLFKSDAPEYRTSHPMFWVSAGALFYFGTNALYFMLNSYFISKAYDAAVISIWSHAVINLIANSLYAQSFRCFRNQKALV